MRQTFIAYSRQRSQIRAAGPIGLGKAQTVLVFFTKKIAHSHDGIDLFLRQAR